MDTRPENIARLQEIHKSIGRDTEVGRLMFNIYNKGKIEYVPAVNIKTKTVDPHKQHQLKQQQAAAALKKPIYKAPKLVSSKSKTIEGPVNLVGLNINRGKKSAVAIAQSVAADPIVYRPAAIDSIESRDSKARKLQDSMAGVKSTDKGLKGKAAAAAEQQKRAAATAAYYNNHIDPDIELRNSLINDISERTEFLRELESFESDKYYQHEQQMKAEIKDKLRDLKKLEQLIEDKQLINNEIEQNNRYEQQHSQQQRQYSHTTAARSTAAYSPEEEEYDDEEQQYYSTQQQQQQQQQQHQQHSSSSQSQRYNRR